MKMFTALILIFIGTVNAEVVRQNGNSLNGISGTLPVANGGTGATDAATAVTNLGALSATNPAIVSGSTVTTSGSVSISTATSPSSIGMPSLFLNAGTRGQVGIGTSLPDVSCKVTIDNQNDALAFMEFSSGTSAGARVGVFSAGVGTPNDFTISGGPGHAVSIFANNFAAGTQVIISSGTSLTTGSALCLNSDRVLSKCSSVVGVDGTCTCL